MMTPFEKYQAVKKAYAAGANKENAQAMGKYMRNLFPFYGLKTPTRRELSKPFLKGVTKEEIAWDLVDLCFEDDYREMQYFALDYLKRVEKQLTFSDLPKIKQLAETKSWWDSVDSLVKLVGQVFIRDEENKEKTAALILTWARDPDFWVRRTAIEFQLGLKEATDPELLGKIIDLNLGSQEFFINKAIGWALRDYSKTKPAWVRSYMASRELSPLSRREGSKYI